ncbi:Uncharacterized protein dnm_093290 [Desulfonema magnum]|uniref:Uncharacterized protein n=1 Tax=Desulfonema magnum TaxID=45655 RepID=A0A975BXP7_9BACT|nr:Uncharacterized protein dnm_093290 [Desulfonema magnum]
MFDGHPIRQRNPAFSNRGKRLIRGTGKKAGFLPPFYPVSI